MVNLMWVWPRLHTKVATVKGIHMRKVWVMETKKNQNINGTSKVYFRILGQGHSGTVVTDKEWVWLLRTREPAFL